ncbi:hypothetical protein ASH00_12390 [Arthrobacter sp. Soil782]|uniref:hypothetical protein n=1 Tax=Arthrobacter sp. Soil782 TaxID=1736410 RepID=UPI0006F98AE1|nr:hypothetical protein [Arthrobacter sp. Soil782]KRF05196.1 hypothetical protein ASH00_12390 [Arthrobacter sp. Soil782]
MTTHKQMSRTRKLAMAGILPIAALSLAGCNSTSGTEAGADVEDVVEEEEAVDAGAAVEPYEGAYDTGFYEDYESYVGEEVTLSADVNEIVSEKSFTIAGTDDTTVEALLVIAEGEMEEVTPGLTVSVTGTVMESFDLPTVEEETGLDLDDEAFVDFDGENYVVAESVDTSVDADS